MFLSLLVKVLEFVINDCCSCCLIIKVFGVFLF